MVVLDTCALIEICNSTASLSHSTYQKINDGAYILSLSFAEIACKIKLRKLLLTISARELYALLLQISTIQIINLSTEDWLDIAELEWDENKDPVDRAIVVFAKQQNLPIVTTNTKIRKLYKNVLW